LPISSVLFGIEEAQVNDHVPLVIAGQHAAL
jgi:hypothetical protein